LKFDPGVVPAVLGHEIAHGLTDDLADLLRERVDRSAGQFAKLGWDCYGSWRQCFRENAVRALMLRHIARTVGDDAARRKCCEEWVDRFPYLDELERLLREEYEAARGRYPTIVEFFPRLIESFPEDPAPAAASPSEDAVAGPGPGREWRLEAVEPFTTDGQRRRAEELLDRLVTRDDARDLRLRRGALRLSLRAYEGAIADADAVLRVDPRHPEARLLRALALEGEGRSEEARHELRGVDESCREGARAALACADAARRLARGASLGAAPAASAWKNGEPGRPSGRYELEMDPRVELLATALRSAGVQSAHARDASSRAYESSSPA
jgi:tetratricopeptide (TPR) repeat protein